MSRHIFALLLCVSCLALGGVFVKLSLLGPINTAFYRVLFALPIFYILCVTGENKFKKYKNKLTSKEKILCLLSGLFLSLDLVLWNISFSYTTVVNANLLSNLVAFTVVPLSYFLFREKPMNSFYLSAPIMLIGVVALFSEKNQLGANHLLGNFLALATSFFYGLFLLTVYRLRSKIDFMVIMYYSCIGSIVSLLPFVFYEGWQFPTDFYSLYPLVGLAMLSQVLGQGGMSYVLGYVNAILASLVMLSQPAISAFYALLLFNEQLTAFQIFAVFIILVGLFVGKLDNAKLNHLFSKLVR